MFKTDINSSLSHSPPQQYTERLLFVSLSQVQMLLS